MPGTTRSRRLLEEAVHRGYLDAEQARVCLEAEGDPVEAAIERGFVTREILQGLTLQLSLQEEASETDRVPSQDDADRMRAGGFGRYRVLEKIGEGATSVVFKALDPASGRPVALKVLRGKGGGSLVSQERFRREIRALAGLRHPNIVSIHEVGRDRDYDFYSMDFIEGPSLQKALDDRALGLDRGLGVLEKVARACHFAHEHGIIHRDLKPGNILLDGRGEPFVTDFGLARMPSEGDRLTTTGAILGTLDYMSPEHVSGRPDSITPRSDVYSLGAIVYELATGRTPFGDRGSRGIFAAIEQDEPLRPRSIQASISADLEAVILKSLEKDPARRYAGAQELAEDLGRARSGEPVHATRYTGLLLLARRLRRHPGAWAAGFAAAAAVVIAVGLWLGGELEQRRRARLAPRVERTQARLTEAAALRGEEGRRQAREILIQAAADLRACVEEDVGYAEAWVGLARALRLLGDDSEAAQALDRAVQETAGSTLVRIERARQNLFRYGEARSLEQGRFQFINLGQRLVLRHVSRRGAAAETPESTRLREVLLEDIRSIRSGGIEIENKDALFLEGALATVDGRLTEAIASLSRALELDRFDARAYAYRGLAKDFAGEIEGAEADLDQAIRLSPLAPHHWTTRAQIRIQRGNLTGARADLNESLSIAPDLISARVRLAAIHLALDDFLAARGEVEEALRRQPESRDAIRQRSIFRILTNDLPGALEDCDRLVRGNPTDAMSILNRAYVRIQLGDAEKALLDAERAVQLEPASAEALSGRALIHLVGGRADAARKDAQEALSIDPDSLPTLIMLARALFVLNRFEEAAARYTQAMDAMPDTAVLHTERGNALRGLGRLDESLKDQSRAVELEPNLAIAHNNRGTTRVELGRLEEAVDDYARAIELDSRYPDAHYNRANTLWRLGRREEALQEYGLAIKFDPKKFEAYNNRGNLKQEMGDFPGAVEDFTAALAIRPETGYIYFNRGNARRRLGRHEEAAIDYDKAIELDPKNPLGYFNRGILRVEIPEGGERLLRDALADFESALRFAPADWPFRPQAEELLGKIRDRLKEF